MCAYWLHVALVYFAYWEKTKDTLVFFLAIACVLLFTGDFYTLLPKAIMFHLF